MYSTSDHGAMIADRTRIQAYEAALKRVVGRNSLVLDLGSGSGIMAFLACRLGARKVLAVEPDGVLHLARQIAEVNGWETRIEFLQGLSMSLEPPHRCDVVVSDIGGVLPLFMRHIPTIIDVRDRWLVEGGIQIPQEDFIFGAVIESPRVWNTHFTGWTTDFDLDFEPALQVRRGTVRRVELTEAETLLSAPARWASIDYRTVTSTNHDAVVSWRALRDGTGHGIALWFDRVLTDDVTLTNRPGEPLTIAGQLYFPWPEPVALQRGDCVQVRIRAHLVGHDYVWAWDTDIQPAATDRVPRAFRQSTLQGALRTSEWLAGRRLDAQTALTTKGRAALQAFRAMERGATTREIGVTLAEQFSAEFPDRREAENFVSGLQFAYGKTE